jgi:hypothetical protein
MPAKPPFEKVSSMYMAHRFIDNQLQYILCESYHNGTHLTNRDLVNLGPEPEQFIIYPGGSSFYIDERLFDLLQAQGFKADYDEVEQFFFPFLDPYIQAKLAPFQHRHRNRNWKPMAARDKNRVLAQTHIFDRRRTHFLRFGQVDQQRLDKSLTLYNKLLDKSRDELEQYILEQEQELSPAEYKNYVFSIFDLQRFFEKSYTRTHPDALDGNKVDDLFIQEICQLDQDQVFWQGFTRGDKLPPYLIRYVVMYFDYSFPGGRSWDEYIQSFADSRRRAEAGNKNTQPMSVDKASTIFGVSRTELAKMDKKEVTRLFRQKAHEHHPDKGGDQDRFVELTAAYKELLRTRR